MVLKIYRDLSALGHQVEGRIQFVLWLVGQRNQVFNEGNCGSFS